MEKLQDQIKNSPTKTPKTPRGGLIQIFFPNITILRRHLDIRLNCLF